MRKTVPERLFCYARPHGRMNDPVERRGDVALAPWGQLVKIRSMSEN
jgi:hypothetical protein